MIANGSGLRIAEGSECGVVSVYLEGEFSSSRRTSGILSQQCHAIKDVTAVLRSCEDTLPNGREKLRKKNTRKVGGCVLRWQGYSCILRSTECQGT